MIIEASQASEGRLLVLFTSYAHLRQTAEAVAAPADRLGSRCCSMAPPAASDFCANIVRKSGLCSLAPAAFGKGVDLPGDELRCLVIVKLPLAVPNDPIGGSTQRRL